MEYNIYEKCKYFDEETMECAHPDVIHEPFIRDRMCIQEECDSFELECPHCKKMIDVDELWSER